MSSDICLHLEQVPR